MSANSTSTILSNLHRLVALQLWSKLLTFVCNVYIVRHVDPSTYGQFAVELTLALNVALFVSRDALRNVAGRFERETQTRDAFAVSLLVLPVALLLIAFIAVVAPSSAAMSVMLLAAFVELLGEPLYAVLQCQLLMSERIKIDGVATLLRCATVLASLRWQLMAFAVGQLVYALAMLAGLALAVQRHQLWRFCTVDGARAVIERHSKLLGGFYWQSLQQMVLTEAEKVALWVGASGFDQGTFSVVGNLGSLVARLVFLPVEETSKAVFQRERDRARSAAVLTLLVKLVLLIGLFAAAFGPAYSYTLLHLLYGARISATSAPFVLQWYCVYILCMAVNGVAEAFVHATADQSQLKLVNAALLAFSGVYIVLASLLLYTFGTVGLVVANCFNMLMRIVFSGAYMTRHFAGQPFSLWQCAPDVAVCAAFASAVVITQLTHAILEPKSPVAHIAVGVVEFATVLGAIYVREKPFLAQLRNILRGGQSEKTE